MVHDNLISIIVPVYNVAPYLERCIRSIQEQTFTNIEILLVDNGSTDGSSELVDILAAEDKRIIPIHEENQGVTHARLTGVGYANGNWIGFVDADDMIEPDMFERLLNNAKQYNAQISHCGYQMIFEDSRVNYFYNTERLALQDKLTGLKDLLDGSFIEPGLWNKLFYKTLFHSLLHDEAMDLSIKNNEDLLMNFILFSNSEKSIFEDFCPYHYIVRRSSASRQTLNKNKIYDPIKVKNNIVELAPEELKNEARAAYLSTCIDSYSVLACERDNKQFQNDKKAVRELILDKKKDAKLLDSRRRVLVNLITYVPHLYPLLYRFYSKFFQKKKYD